ncbi:hypothetical protein [Chromatium okenii]
MSNLTRQSLAEKRWMIEVYHRDLKQNCGVERCQARSAIALVLLFALSCV